MVLSNTSQRALFALQTHVGTMQNATRILSRGFATKLGNSMSDGNYESNVGQSSPGPDRPTSKDASVTRARAAQSSMTDPQMLANSLSDGVYPTNQHSRRRFDLSLGLSSISDPETFWAGSSMSDGYYEMPTALRAGPRSSKRSHSYRSAGPQSLPLMQRVVSKNISPATEGRLHNSYSHSGY